MRRGVTAAEAFEPKTHEYALYAGGHPGVAQNWPEEHIPQLGIERLIL